MLLNNIFCLLLLIISFQFQSCKLNEDNKIYSSFNQVPVQKITHADSLFVLYTLKEFGKHNWWTFQDYSKMYNITNDRVEYFIGRVFYNSDKRKIIIWYGEKSHNASTLESYSDNPKENRLCPTGGDIVYSMSALIGFRDSIHQIWNLYPFDNQSVSCSPSEERVMDIMEQYYLDKMKGHEMLRIIQSGLKKGESELKAYAYNIQDNGFWEKCWLWEKDTIGANKLYPFQIESYISIKGQKCNNCAKPFSVPKINYPAEILALYK